MADIIGTLAESTSAVVGTVTLYTVPSGKAAKGRLMYRGVSGVNSTLSFTVNGVKLFQSAALTTGHIIYSTNALIFNDAATDATVNGSSAALTVNQAPFDYYLSEGETITYTIATNDFSSFKAVFVGTEVDAS